MIRFTTRDLLWLTVVAALALALWLQRADHAWRLNAVRNHSMALRKALVNAEYNEGVYLATIERPDTVADLADVDWALIDKFVP